MLAVLLAFAFAGAAVAFGPRGFEAGSLLAVQDDPVALADRAVAQQLTADVATREIEAALRANDADLAQSFLDLSRDRTITIAPDLVAKVEAANTAAATATRSAESFARGLFTGEPDDLAGFVGTATGDLFVFGDIRDAIREGSRYVSGQPVDELVLGLAGVGLAVTAGTYAMFGAAAPARVGLTLVKAARKTGRLTAHMGEWIGRSVREVVDWTALRRAVGEMSVADPAVAVRAARAAVKVERSDDLMRLVSDVGRVQSKAGTKAALDGLKLAETPRDVARVARLAEVKGSRTRATLKLAGRGAIALTLSAFNLAWWVFGVLLTLIGFCASLKSTAERVTLRHLQKKKLRRARIITYARA